MSADDPDDRMLLLAWAAVAHSRGVRCPLCPSCGGVPEPAFASLTWPGQALCDDDDCPVLFWNPTQTARVNLENGQTIDLPGEHA